MIWSVSDLDSVWHWCRTFKHRREVAVVGASGWGEVVVEEPHTTYDEYEYAQVPTEGVSKWFPTTELINVPDEDE
jgi:hypothetical protein